jgi:hypothetical protein
MFLNLEEGGVEGVVVDTVGRASFLLILSGF